MVETPYISSLNTSIKTRIETPLACDFQAGRAGIPLSTLPLKQGLKPFNRLGLMALVALPLSTLPLKQGLKPGGQQEIRLRAVPLSTLPLKQGLKPLSPVKGGPSRPPLSTLPLKQGLKPRIPGITPLLPLFLSQHFH